MGDNPNFNPNFVIFRFFFVFFENFVKTLSFSFWERERVDEGVDISLDHERSRAN